MTNLDLSIIFIALPVFVLLVLFLFAVKRAR